MKRSSCGSSATIANGLPALLGRRRERTREEFDAFCLSRHRYGQAACACDRLPPSELNGALVRRCSRNEICPAFRFATAAVLDDTTVGTAVGSADVDTSTEQRSVHDAVPGMARARRDLPSFPG